jgi:hypothetical protein
MVGALARELSRVIPGADPDAVRNWILQQTTTHSDNPVAQQIEGAAALPFTAAGKLYDKGVSMLPSEAQPVAKSLGEVGSDVMALAPGAAATHLGINQLASAPEQTIARAPEDVAKEAGYTGLKTKADMRGTQGAQSITDALINEDAGLPRDAVPTVGTIETARLSGPAKVYDQVRDSLPQNLTQDETLKARISGLQDKTSQLPKTEGVQDLKDTMLAQPTMTRQELFANISDARARSSQYLASDDPKNQAVGAAYRELADAYEDFASRQLPQDAGVTVGDFRQARTQFAKNYDAQYALRGENYDPLVYGRIAQHDPHLLSGNSAIVAHVVNGLPAAGITNSFLHGAAPYVVGGTLGGALGNMLGSPELGAMIGTIGGPLAKNALRNFATRGDPEAAAGASTNPALSYFQRDYELPDWWGRDPPVDLRSPAPELSASSPTSPPRSPVQGAPSLADVLAGNLSLGEHQTPQLTASTPRYPYDPYPVAKAPFAPSEADRLSQGLELAPEHAAATLAGHPDFARVLSSLVPEGLMSRMPAAGRGMPTVDFNASGLGHGIEAPRPTIPLSNDDVQLQRLAAQYGLTPDVIRAGALHPGTARAATRPPMLALPHPSDVAIPLPDEADVLSRLAEQYGYTPDIRRAAALHPGTPRASSVVPSLLDAEMASPVAAGAGLKQRAQQKAIQQALESQAGYARGGYHSELSLMRHW